MKYINNASKFALTRRVWHFLYRNRNFMSRKSLIKPKFSKNTKQKKFSQFSANNMKSRTSRVSFYILFASEWMIFSKISKV